MLISHPSRPLLCVREVFQHLRAMRAGTALLYGAARAVLRRARAAADGETTTLGALARDVNADGRQVALLFSCETTRVAVDDYRCHRGRLRTPDHSSYLVGLVVWTRPLGSVQRMTPGSGCSSFQPGECFAW
jgi:hypothetical protein